ncbi:MAG TPA: hypothetical protein VLC09_15330, partial [Polyangiaceae bacterium]|nr:hypothetical protein [Polyangiaceae bacterium]
LELAIENAREGCVAETQAALLVARQASAATNEELRVDLARIAADEASHAQLAWDLHGIYLERLNDDERRVLEAELEVALRRLEEGAEPPEPNAFERGMLGLPPVAEAVALRRGLARQLRAAAAGLMAA